MENLDCRQLDELLCDYVDGTLNAEQQVLFEKHLTGCAACRELVADVSGAVHFMERAADVEAPRELVTRILYHTPQNAPLVEKLAQKDWLRRWVAPFLQPRFAMGMAMTILSFSMLGKFVTPVRQLKPSDLDPVKVWRSVDDSAHRAWDRMMKYYENLRLVYEVQMALEDIKGDSAPATGAETEQNQKQTGEPR
jgi:anti-sigma factor RsiW